VFAGGEELWVFVNGIMVVQIFHDPSVIGIPCKAIKLNDGKNILVSQYEVPSTIL